MPVLSRVENGPRSTRRNAAVECAGAEKLCAWAEAEVTRARDGVECSPEENGIIRTLSSIVFMSGATHEPEGDRERKAYVLCALHKAISFNDKSWKRIYKRYAQSWQIKESTIRPFWLQPFLLAGETWVLFEERMDGRLQLHPVFPWPSVSP
jgi:hypothetical protein